MSPTIPAAKKSPVLTILPSEIIFEILTWLPGKPVVRCKCVCKAWLSMIRSCPFRKTYRSRQRGLILYWSDGVVRDKRSDVDLDLRLRFYYSPLRRLNERRPDDFYPLPELDLSSWYSGVTRVVNGLVCSGAQMFATVMELTLHNVFTGEDMRVPDPEYMFGRFEKKESTYHLGYVSMTGEYKILRLVFQCDRHGFVGNLPLRALTIVLRPPGSNSTWRWIAYKDTGLADLRMPSKVVFDMVLNDEARTFFGDGFVCWYGPQESLILFNFQDEKFRKVKLPEEGLEHEKRVFVRSSFNGSACLALYVLRQDEKPECFVLEDERWKKEHVEFPEDIREMEGGLAVAAGDDKLLLMGNQENGSRLVYSYDDDKSVERFKVGKLPNKPLDLDGKSKTWQNFGKFDARLSCLQTHPSLGEGGQIQTP